MAQTEDSDIAIVGMAAHLPGAAHLSEFWRNLRDGVESIRRLDEAALLEAGEDPGLMRHRNYVPAAATLDGFADFDAEFFGFSPKDATVMDPQHRQFLEVAWEALEIAGHPPESIDGPIGVFAGCGMGSYFYFNICTNPELVRDTGMFLLRHTGNDKDFLATRVSHVFDLRGPSINIQTACSTSLVAVHYAVQALQNGECDLALAGGVTIEMPHGRGYVFRDGEILSPDGHCHAFDHRAQGTVFGSGAGVVALRRLPDALADGDHIWAVIKGSAVNNDGADKAGYLAPSVGGQAAAVAEALAVADVAPESIDYVECHGTGTYLGDPIEVAALTEAFRTGKQAQGFCRIGSVKTNIGHLDTAAGAAGLIKTALALHHRQMPPSLGYERANPAIDFETSPFRVNDRLGDWPLRDGPRRAGVNSLGVGGTNAHVVLEEAPAAAASETSDWPFQLLTLSARSDAALDANAEALAEHLLAHPEQSLADVAFTLKEGRRAFAKRRVLVAATHEKAAALLRGADAERVFSHSPVSDAPECVFMFPGGGAQYPRMAGDLYETEPVFRDWMDRGLEILSGETTEDIRALWLAEGISQEAAAERLRKPSLQLPLIMICEYALAQMWMSWGVRPAALVGHSMGENTAACLAGVMSFEDCIGLVALRGRLFDRIEGGGMLSVGLSEDALRAEIGDDLDIAARNAAELCVVSGPVDELEAMQRRLEAREIPCQRVAIDVAAHSRSLDPILAEFGDFLRSITLSPPAIEVISNRSGAVLTAAQATDPDYWVEHLRHRVDFAGCAETLAATPGRVFLEMGPGQALSSLMRMQGAVRGQQVVSLLRHPRQEIEDDRHFLECLGRLWALGVEVDWSQVWGETRRRRVVLPTYAFQRSRYFIEPGAGAVTEAEGAGDFLPRIEGVENWGWRRHWRRRYAEIEGDVDTELRSRSGGRWLVFLDEAGLGAALVSRLRGAGQQVITISAGDAFARRDEETYVLAPERGRAGYDALIGDLVARGIAPDRVVHLWLVTTQERHRPGSSFFHRNLEQGFYSLLFLGQAIAAAGLPMPLHLAAVTTGAVAPGEDALAYPEKACALGPIRVIPREVPGFSAALIDIAPPRGRTGRRQDGAWEALTEQLLEDLLAPPGPVTVALRDGQRFEQELRHEPLAPLSAEAGMIAPGAVILVTGGFGGIGLSISERLLSEGAGTLVLQTRAPLPERAEWDDALRRMPPDAPVARRIAAVRKLEAMGATVAVECADVSNIADMRALRDRIEARHGRVIGVIHAAGVIDDGPMLSKTPAGIEAVFAPKLHGTEVLDAVFPDGSLDWLALFSSTSVETAPAGQVDYVAANAFLDAYAQSRRGGRTRVFAINWGLWSEVGMAAEAVARRDRIWDTTARHPVDAPLVQAAVVDAGGNRLVFASLDASQWVLDDHRTRDGGALLPGTGHIELAAEALRANGETGAFALRDLYFLRPLTVDDGDAPVEVRLRLARSDAGYDLTVESHAEAGGKTGWLPHAEAKVLMRPLPAGPALDLAAIAARCPRVRTAEPGQALASAQSGQLRFGPRWQVLREARLGTGEGLAHLALPEGIGADGMELHPAILDIATGWAMELIDGYDPSTLWVPVSYGEIRVFRPLPAKVASWVRNAADNRQAGETALFDVTICTPGGEICAEVTGFAIHRLAEAAALGRTAAIAARDLRGEDEAVEGQPLSRGEEMLRHNLSQGIGAQDGAEAFLRVLGSGLAGAIVSSLDPGALRAQSAEAARAAAGSSRGFARPAMETDFVAPRSEVERTLAGFWQELLGVTDVGVEDDFFDLGGHSLVAVRLFSMIRRAYRVDFPMSVLFEAPTIAGCAALIEARIGRDEGDGAADPDAGAPSGEDERRFRHLVAMHEGEGGARRPFFLVAGMFGNVLNLRHLAQLIGADRPFYGVQARGLYGGETPHDDLAQAAADYIAEMRQVQPEGPYLLGGFSGGGITAYEIARQLEAAGESVALLAMLDTPLPQRRPLSRADRLAIHLQEFRAQGIAYPLRWARNRLAWEIARRRAPGTGQADESQFHDAEIEAAFLRATAAYPMRRWDGHVTLLRPPLVAKWRGSGGALINSQRAYVTDDNDWSAWVDSIEVIEVPGDHDSMVLEPNVRVLAAALRERIARAEAAQRPVKRAPRTGAGNPTRQAAE